MRIGRMSEIMPHLQFMRGKSIEVVRFGKLQRRVRRRKGLHDHLALRIPATRTPRDLHEELERPLPRAEVRQMQRRIRTDDSHQSHSRKVQPLGDHLRADQDVNFPAAERPERFVIRTLARHGVRIHPRHPGRRKHLPHHGLDLFRAHAAESNLRIVALRTPPRRLLRVTADMATRQVLLFVQGERNTAVRTLHVFPAGLAGQHGEKSAAVEKENRLLALGQARFNGESQLWRNELVVAFTVLAPQTHIDHPKDRQHASVVTVAQFEQIVFPLPVILEAFE